MGNAIQTVLDKHERFDYVWPDENARQSETSMVQGSRGYQVDTESEYIFDNFAWQLRTAHTEYTAAHVNIPDGAVTGCGTLTLDASQSTSTTQTSTTDIGGTGQIIFANTGVYAYHALAMVGGPNGTPGEVFGNRTFIELAVGGNVIARQNGVGNETIMGLSLSNLRITSPNQPTFTQIYQTSTVDQDFETRIRITRLS